MILKLLWKFKTSGSAEIILNENVWETYLLKMPVCSTAASHEDVCYYQNDHQIHEGA